MKPKNEVIFAILGVMLAAGLVAIPAVGKAQADQAQTI
jgi:hypothetical protein